MSDIFAEIFMWKIESEVDVLPEEKKRTFWCRYIKDIFLTDIDHIFSISTHFLDFTLEIELNYHSLFSIFF